MEQQTNHFNYIPPPPLPIEESSSNKNIIEKNFHSNGSQFRSSNLQEIFSRAGQYAEKEDWQRAVEAYEKLIDLLPQNSQSLATVYSLIALCSSKLGERDKAIRYFKKALKLWPDNHEFHLGLGMEYLLMDKAVKAIQSFREVIKLNKREAYAYFYLGYLYAKQRQWDLATTHYKETINVDRSFEQAYIYLANLYFILGQKKSTKKESFFLEAIEVFKALLEVKGRMTWRSLAYNNIGFLYSSLGRYDVALNAYQKAIELEPFNEIVQKNTFTLKNALVKEKLLKKGSLKRVPEPITDFKPYKNRKTFRFKGKPLSQTILEERR